ncbi:MAG: HAD-IA family hydrolase, partial [Gemmatimonadetes bacterium]|nr:HAD-IA family hydrolase [Gemmatimonadota bacterium]
MKPGIRTRPGLIVFDLDGTLVDSRRDLAAAANRLIEECGGEPLDEARIGRMVGSGAAVLVQRALAAGGVREHPAGAVERYLRIYELGLLDHTRVYDGVAELLDSCAKICPLAVLTNKPRTHTRKILSGLDIEARFVEVLGGDGPYPLKPEPAGFEHLARSCGVTPAHALLVGDSAIDLETAERAKTGFCFARYGFGAHSVPPELARRCALVVD